MKKTEGQIIIEKTLALVKAIKENETDLWIPSLECTVECVIMNDDHFPNMHEDDSDDPDFEVLKFSGIRHKLFDLEQSLQIFGIEKFSRKCDITGKGMNEGYCWHDGTFYSHTKENTARELRDDIKEDGVMHSGKLSNDELLAMSDDELLDWAYEEEILYWTEWLDDSDTEDSFYDADGNLYEYDKDGVPFKV